MEYNFKSFYLLNEGVTYTLPASPRYLMADFYILSFIDSIDFESLASRPSPTNPSGMASALRGEKYREDIKYAKSVLYPFLQKTILADTFFSICCEGSYALLITDSNGMYFGKDSVDKDFIRALPLWYKALARAYEQAHGKATHDESARYETEKSNYLDRYTTINNYLKENGKSKTEFVQVTMKVFNHTILWSSQYGGTAWGAICDGWLHLNKVDPNDYNKAAVYIDHLYDLEHNNGTVFNKLRKYAFPEELTKGYAESSRYHGFGWIKELLDYKASVKNPYDLLRRTSGLMQKLASPVLKAAGYSRLDTENKNEQYHYTKMAENEGYREYWTNEKGEYNRANGPAVISVFTTPVGTYHDDADRSRAEIWYTNGKINREGGPAYTNFYKNGNRSEFWYLNGDIHRVDGPAEIHYNAAGDIKRVEYKVYGKKMSVEEFKLYQQNLANAPISKKDFLAKTFPKQIPNSSVDKNQHADEIYNHILHLNGELRRRMVQSFQHGEEVGFYGSSNEALNTTITSLIHEIQTLLPPEEFNKHIWKVIYGIQARIDCLAEIYSMGDPTLNYFVGADLDKYDELQKKIVTIDDKLNEVLYFFVNVSKNGIVPPSEKKEDFLGLVQHLLAYYKLDPKKAYENFMSAL